MGYLYLSGWMSLCPKTDTQPPGSAFIGLGSPAGGSGSVASGGRSNLPGQEREREQGDKSESRGHCQRSQPDYKVITSRQRWSSNLKFTFCTCISTNSNDDL